MKQSKFEKFDPWYNEIELQMKIEKINKQEYLRLGLQTFESCKKKMEFPSRRLNARRS